jgi:ATP-dependent RNA helicase RhlE
MTNEKQSKHLTEDEGKLDFYGLGIAPKLLEILEQLRFTTPTPIQIQSIPVINEGKDMVGIAQTGTGKTLAFGVPMIQRLAELKGKGLILLPTRELAQQVEDHLKQIGQRLGLRTAVLIGGEPIRGQLRSLRAKPHILIATPGRLVDHLKHNYVSLADVKVLVFDEADMMFDMGFAPQIKEVLFYAPKNRQTLLFSATMPPEIMQIATEHMSMPVRIEVAPAGTAAENVIQEMIILKREDKLSQLEKILKEYAGTVLVFARTKYGVKDLCYKIKQMDQKSAEIHSNRSLAQRREALAGFKNGRYRILVATDIAARGIDVKGIELVLNYDLPDNSEDYVHRIGRTGRAGKAGRAVSFATPSQLMDIKKIERLIKQEIPLTKLTNISLPKPITRHFKMKPGRSFAIYHSSTAKKDENKQVDKRYGENKKFNPRRQQASFAKPVKTNNNKFSKKSSFSPFEFLEEKPIQREQGNKKRFSRKKRY